MDSDTDSEIDSLTDSEMDSETDSEIDSLTDSERTQKLILKSTRLPTRRWTQIQILKLIR